MLLLLLQLLGPAWGAEAGVVKVGTAQIEGPDALVEEAYAALSAGDFLLAAERFGSLAEGGAGDSARYLQGLSLYEAGELRAAESALDGVGGLEASNLRGLVLVERGAQALGLTELNLAKASDDPALSARATLNIARVRMDQGRLGEADALIQSIQLSDAAIQDSVAQARAALSALREDRPTETSGGLDVIADSLRRGSSARARVELDGMRARAVGARGIVDVGLAEGAILRAEGRPDAASAVLMDALTVARSSGLAWQTGQCLFALGIAHSLAGRLDLALSFLVEARTTAEDAGFLATAAEYSAEIGLLAIRLERQELAEQELDAVRALLGTMEHPAAQARAYELEGAVAARQGKTTEALAALQKALDWQLAKGHYADAARIAVAQVRATTGRDAAGAKAAVARATTLFEQIGDPVGPAHIALAEGLGFAEQKELEAALRSFARAAEMGRNSGRRQGEFVAATAEENAAQALVALGASSEAARLAAEGGMADVVAQHQALVAAMERYETGLAAYERGDFGTARTEFQAAVSAFGELGERAYAARAERALFWSAYNTAISLPAQESLPYWSELVEAGRRLGDDELLVRSTAARALVAAEVGPARGALADSAALAMERGFPEVAARVYARLAEEDDPLTDRALHARKAYALGPELEVAVYAMYSVAVDAYNADELELARALSEEVLSGSGGLREAVEAVLDATAP